MSMLAKWKKDIEDHSVDQESQERYWRDYCNSEKTIYQDILKENKQKFETTINELANTYKIPKVWAMGFLDGVSESLNTPLPELETIEKDTVVSIDIDYEKLYKNMLDVPADWLYNLEEWDNILTQERRSELKKEYKRSKTVVNANKIGRNDPCICGSGKKYKKCCGR